MKNLEKKRLSDWLELLNLRRRVHFDSHEYSGNKEADAKLSEYNFRYGVFRIDEYKKTNFGWMRD